METTMKRVDDWEVRNGYELNTLKVDVGRYKTIEEGTMRGLTHSCCHWIKESR
jgi:hypothetical protein